MTMYTSLLQEALKTAEQMHAASNDPTDQAEWKRLIKVCRLELYKLDNKIKPARKKDLTSFRRFSTMDLQYPNGGPTPSGARLKG